MENEEESYLIHKSTNYKNKKRMEFLWAAFAVNIFKSVRAFPRNSRAGN